MQRADRAKQYLVAVRHVANDNIKVIDGGYREKRDLELYVVFERYVLLLQFPQLIQETWKLLAVVAKERLALPLDEFKTR